MSLNERMGAFTGYEAPFLTLAPAARVAVEAFDVRVEELVQDLERERQALARRARFRLVRGAQQSEGHHLSVA